MKVKLLSRVRLLATPWTTAHQALRPWDFPGRSTGVKKNRYVCIYNWITLLWTWANTTGLITYQIRSVSQSCPTLCDPMNRSTPGLPVHHQPPEFTETHIHWVSDAIQPSHPLSSPSPPALNPSQHQSLLQWVNSSHEVAKVLEFQL